MLRKLLIIFWLNISQGIFFDPQNLSMYEYMDLYNKKSSMADININCPGFICEHSGLLEININLLLHKENQIRDIFASTKKLSNVYVVKWNSFFAEIARRKVILCLPPTSYEQTIFDTEILKDLPNYNQLNDTKTAKAVEVVIGTKTIPIISPAYVTNFYDQMETQIIDLLNEKNFNQQDALLRRGNTVFMGCDYLLRNNVTHVMGSLVCLYGLLYFSDDYYNRFRPFKGNPCSRCDEFFNRHPILSSSVNFSKKWACDLIYTHLCTNVYDSTYHKILPHPYSCNGEPEVTLVENVTFQWITVPYDQAETLTTWAPHQWPCYQYTVPIVLITLVVFVLIVYNIITVIIDLVKNKNKI